MSVGIQKTEKIKNEGKRDPDCQPGTTVRRNKDSPASCAPSQDERDGKRVNTKRETETRKKHKELMFWGMWSSINGFRGRAQQTTSRGGTWDTPTQQCDGDVYNMGRLWTLLLLLKDSHKQRGPSQIIPVSQIARSWEKNESVLMSPGSQPL